MIHPGRGACPHPKGRRATNTIDGSTFCTVCGSRTRPPRRRMNTRARRTIRMLAPWRRM